MNTAAVLTVPAEGLHPTWKGLGWDAERWPHFTPRELACRCGGRFCKGEYFHHETFLDRLEALRELSGEALLLNSARRCKKHNAAVGGATRSQHTLAMAADISLTGLSATKLARDALRAGFTALGFGRSFLHVDIREERTAFHYPGADQAWRTRFGFDPVERYKRTGAL